MPAATARWTCSPYSVTDADRLARKLDLPPAVAAILVRRGYRTVDDAGSFLDADERHDPFLFEGMRELCDRVLAHVSRRSRIVVHGDYDADGVCSTAILVRALRAVGADPAWHLPSRLEDGYGLSGATVERLAARGAGLLITADCGITAPAEVELARERGMDVVVTDHHRPGDALPRCPILHPVLGNYPFPDLCAAGVVHKLSAALRGVAGLDPTAAEDDLDLVALATICDVVPLRGENRRLVREGLRALARTSKPGLRALMEVAALDPGAVDERAVGFRLGPRINAAGRVRRADAALELLLTEDAGRAGEIAAELNHLNHERQDAETRILFCAEAARAEQPDAPAYVIAGDDWHPGVIGIVASRLAEQHHRPGVLIALDGESGRGSGRGIPGFDLHAALAECASHLTRFGGHKAAAGLELDRSELEPFRRAFLGVAAARLTAEDLTPVQRIDAVVSAGALGLPLAEQLERLAPFGQGNPEPTLLVPAARVANVAAMGDDGQHARFTLEGGGGRARGVAFRTPARSLAAVDGAPCDAAVTLELNEWQGAVEPRPVLRALCPTAPGICRVVGAEESMSIWAAVERELSADLEAPPPEPGPRARAIRDRRGEGLAGLAGELITSGEPVLIVCADPWRRREMLERVVAGLARGAPGAAGAPPAELAVTSWEALAVDRSDAHAYQHLLAIDPPLAATEVAALASVPVVAGRSFVHLAWGPAEIEFALAVAGAGLELREPLTGLYRALRSAGRASGLELADMLRGDGAYPRPPSVCGRLMRVLVELRLVTYEAGGGAPACPVLDALTTALERSPAYRAYRDRLDRARRYLSAEADWQSARRTAPAAAPAPAQAV